MLTQLLKIVSEGGYNKVNIWNRIRNQVNPLTITGLSTLNDEIDEKTLVDFNRASKYTKLGLQTQGLQ